MSKALNWLLCGHRNPRNIGDQLTDLRLYFDELQELDWVDIEDLPNHDLSHYKGVIFGAGGMLYGESQRRIEQVVETGKPVCIFGAGLNYDGDKVQYPHWLSKCRYVALRDWGSPYDWCPCPSALHEAFDEPYDILYSQVSYGHALQSSLRHESSNMSEEDFKYLVEHLANADVVRTDSYHGAYWTSLLDRTPCIDSSVTSIKFKTFHPQPLETCRRAIRYCYARLLEVL